MTDGDTIDVGDRTLVAKRPPLYDNPTTRALFDPKTSVLWSVDTFATNVPTPMPDVAALSADEFRDGQFFGGRLVSPWVALLDEQKFRRVVDDFQHLNAEAIAGCHCPILQGTKISEAYDFLRQLPGIPPWTEFTQADLDQWMAVAEFGPTGTAAAVGDVTKRAHTAPAVWLSRTTGRWESACLSLRTITPALLVLKTSPPRRIETARGALGHGGGTCSCNTEGFELTLELAPPPIVPVPEELHLTLVEHAPDGRVPQVITATPVKEDFRIGDEEERVVIRNRHITVPIKKE